GSDERRQRPEGTKSARPPHMSEPQRPNERAPEAEPWSARTPVKTEDLPDWSPVSTSGARAASTFARRMKAAVLEALERARAGLSMREDNFFLLLSVIIGLFAGQIGR